MEISTLAIIGERYLDTQHDDEYIERLECELQRRGITGAYRWALEYLAASSLWWNVIWWEWSDLNEKDIQLGWLQNAVLFAIAGFIVSIMYGIYAGLGVIIILHILTTWLGLALRAGTKRNK